MEKKDNTVIGNITSKTDEDGNLAIQAEEDPFSESFYFIDYYDDKAIKSFIKNVERLIRTSHEYSTYIEAVRTNVGVLNTDTILHNISNLDASLEFHHYPFTLYEIIEIIMTHDLIQNRQFNSFTIAEEVMNCHYANQIGLVSLTKTTHELAHLNSIFLTKDQIFGNYQEFIDKYSDGISAEEMMSVTEMERKSAAGENVDYRGIL